MPMLFPNFGESLGEVSTFELALSNASFESGDLTGWTVIDSGWAVATDAASAHTSHDLEGTNEFPRSGSYALWGTEAASMAIHQDVDVSAYAIEIDAGTAEITGKIWCRDTFGDDDRVRVSLECWDAGTTTLLGTINGPWVSDYGAWFSCVASAAIPASTRVIRFIIEGDRLAGSLCNVGADDASLSIKV